MIVGTAGHIDHGKTTLVKALTGVDTDRLPEEKKRGISIELGYAYLDVPLGAQADAADRGAAGPERIGFIDVPGHERLVHTMLAGASGIDLALLLVAADDGVMPQTREHLAVLSLLGLGRGAVVLTKVDRADAARVAAVREDVAALIATTPLAAAPLFEVAAITGQGVALLRDWLFEQARGWRARAQGGAAFRLAIDRAFTLEGVGTVATGTVHAGTVRVGDELVIAPGAGAQRARVRSLHAQNRVVDVAQAGQRCAVALAGVAKDSVPRGAWLVPEAAASVSERIDAWLTLWQGEAKALRAGTPVHLHLGAAEVEATLALLDAGEAIAPGERKRVQLVLRRPIGAWHGDRIVLRDASASRTLAGGTVLDAAAPARYRRTPQRLAELDACSQPELTGRLIELLKASVHGLELRRFARGQGLAPGVDLLLPEHSLRATDSQGDWALDAAHAQELAARSFAALQAYHQKNPEELGPDAGRLRRLSAPRLPEPLWRALLARALAQGQLAQRGAIVHLREHGIKLSATEERIAQKVAPMLAEAGFEGAWVRDLARDAKESEALLRTTLARLAQRGELHQVIKDLFYPHATITRLAALARALAAQHQSEVTAAMFRDATQLGRKRAIQILEYFDRVGLTRRVQDTHRLRSDTDLFRETA